VRAGPEKQWWKGESINPYPLLNPPASKPGAASAASEREHRQGSPGISRNSAATFQKKNGHSQT
jgi:hypothetical protein